MSDERRRPTEEERDAIIIEAQREGGICAACGRVLSTDEPVWQQRLEVRRDWSWYFRVTHRWAFVGRECAPPEVVRESEGREPVACEGCGRGMHYRVAQNRRATVCSHRCRVIRDRRRSKEGQPS